MRKTHIALGILVSMPLFITACGGGGGGSDGDPEETLTNSMAFANSTVVQGLPPAATGQPGDAFLDAPTTTDTVSASTTSGSMPISYNNVPAGTNFNVNIRFGTSSSSYISVPVDNSGGASTFGTVGLPFAIDPAVCDNLADIEHQIKCFESVDIGNGAIVSPEQARNLVLSCKTNTATFSGSGSFCAYNYPREACTLLQDSITASSPSISVTFNSGTGIAACGPFPDVELTQDFAGTGLPDLGACVVGGF